MSSSGAEGPGDLIADGHAFTASVDNPVDYLDTVQVANEAFDDPSAFDADHLRWLYERCFSEGSTVVSLRTGTRKVGQFAIVRQTVVTGGVAEPAAQLVDLLILKPFRSRSALAALYAEVETQCRTLGIRFAIGMPNASAIAVNEHFLGMQPHQWLDIHAGISISTLPSPSLVINERFSADRTDLYRQWFAFYATGDADQGVRWTADTLCARLGNPRFQYGLHAVENLLLVSSPRVRRGMPYLLLCGYFVRRNTEARKRDVRAVTRAACHFWRRPLFVYPGFNKALPYVPGWRLPYRLRPSTMLLQLRDFRPDQPPLQLDRYQPLDFDFA